MSEENRATIDAYLAEIGASVGKNIRLNEQGISAFTYEELTIVVEVPETIPSFFVYTKLTSLGQMASQDLMLKLMKKSLQLNYLQQETRGGCLSLDPMNDELMFSYSDRVSEITSTDFRNILENFIDTALTLSKIVNGLELGSDEHSGSKSQEMSQSEQDAMMQSFNMNRHHIVP